MSLKSLVAEPPSGRSRPLLIDDADYSTAVIRQGSAIPWTDTAALAAHFGQVRRLLDPDAQWIDVGRVLDAHCRARPDLVSAMGARTRTGFPLRVALGDEAVTESTIEALGTVADSCSRELVLRLPSPATWLTWAHRLAGTALDGVDSDRADSASMYVAEWLGRLGALPVAVLLIDARDSGLAPAEQLDSYTALSNIAGHFDWAMAMHQPGAIQTSPHTATLGFLVPEFWTQEVQLPTTDVLVTTIPPDATPETVLDRLALLH